MANYYLLYFPERAETFGEAGPLSYALSVNNRIVRYRGWHQGGRLSHSQQCRHPIWALAQVLAA